MPLLSICIPTYNRPTILREVLESIFSQGVDSSLYEVCISDNAKTDENQQMVENNFKNQKNLVYHRSTCEGFYNSVEALKLGSGTFLKLNNDTGKFRPGALSKMLETLGKQANDTVFFFTMENENTDVSQKTFSDFNSFMYEISYRSTWSSAFCIGKVDLEQALLQNIPVDKMFPHTSLLFSLYKNSHYVVDEYKYIDTIEVGKKGGYNIPETFGTRYINMVNSLFIQHQIKKATFTKIKSNIINFIADWYVKGLYESEKYVYDFSHKAKYVFRACGPVGLIHFYYDVLKNKRKRIKAN